ncbi:hypothetical protein ILYODFUR_007110 [Ilyodon furcidens]|uniref:Uncharacterized protein n=1 Tax=Ilyodon furcidens TaxID=33524 RepID=A0ABV0SW57_9TELE
MKPAVSHSAARHPSAYCRFWLEAASRTTSFANRRDEIHWSSGTAEAGYHPGARPGLGRGLVHEFLVAGLLLEGPGRAKPEQKKEGQPPVGPPPVGGTMRDWWKEDRAADGGGDLDNLMLQLDLPNTTGPSQNISIL